MGWDEGGGDKREECDAGDDGDVTELLAGAPVAGVQWVIWTIEIDEVRIGLAFLLLINSAFWRGAWRGSVDVCLNILLFLRWYIAMMLVH